MAKTFIKKEVTPEVISMFLDGRDPQERIVNFDYQYQNDYIKIFYRDKDDNRCVTTEPFYPFLWATKNACLKLCNQDRNELVALMKQYNIWTKALDTTNSKGEVVESILDGYTYMFYATKPMSYSSFLEFFVKAGNPVYAPKKNDKDSKPSFTDQPTSKKDSRQYLVVTPIEQFMISTGKRMFKGYNDYDECLRMAFDLETTGLDTKKDRIEEFGITDNHLKRVVNPMALGFKLMLLLILFPLWIFSWWPSMPVYWIPMSIFKAKMKDPMFEGTLLYGSAVLFTLPVFSLITLLVVGRTIGWLSAIVYVALFPLLMLFCWKYAMCAKRTYQSLQCLLKPSSVDCLKRMRKSLHEKLNNVLKK